MAVVYCCLSIILIPWTFYLSLSLPTRHLSSHWSLIWVGFDAGLVILLLATGLLAYLRSVWVVIAAPACGSFLITDAWFDILSAKSGNDLKESVTMAVFVELPLAVMSYSLAHHIVMKNLKQSSS